MGCTGMGKLVALIVKLETIKHPELLSLKRI